MRRFYASFPLLLCAAAAGPAAAAHAGGDAASLIAVEHQWVHAVAEHDRAALARLLDENFTDISWRGTIRTRADLLNAANAPATETQTLSDMKTQVYGDVGLVRGLNVVTAKNHAWRVRLRFTDVFVRKGGGWRAVAAQETLVAPADKRK